MYGFDGSMMTGLQLLEQWRSDFHDPQGSTLGLMTCVQNIGALCALPFAPIVSDQLGRRMGLFIGSCIMLGGVALQTQSISIEQFILSRGMIGLGLGFATNSAPLLITELAYPTQRGPITASYNSSWYLGSIVAAWTTFGTFRMANNTWSWRIPSVLQALPSLLQVIFVWFVPESPRYLISKGKDHQAKLVLGKYHGNGNIDHPLVHYEFNEIKEAMSMEKDMSQQSYLYLFRTKGNLRRMRVIIALGVFSQWSGNGLVSYYINIVLENVGITAASIKTLINAVLQLFNYLMALTSAIYVDRIGRRTLFLISNVGMLVAFGLWTMTSALWEETQNKMAANATIAMIFIYYGFYDIAYSPLLVAYTVEILPFAIRAKGFAVMNFTVSVTLIFNQYVNPVALKALGWKYYLFYCGWLAFELFFIYMYLWETKGRTLEQTAALFDGDGRDTDRELTRFSDARGLVDDSYAPSGISVSVSVAKMLDDGHRYPPGSPHTPETPDDGKHTFKVQEIGAEGYRHRSIVSDSSHNHGASPRSEKYHGEQFEMSPQTVAPSGYDWDRAYYERQQHDVDDDGYTSPPRPRRASSKRVPVRY
ncbi:hypothetical protein FRC05_007863 [Tulasnella sp. 425]|nr:hypothetical protein FRC05_007863 [Tulasnella sp. 425]